MLEKYMTVYKKIKDIFGSVGIAYKTGKFEAVFIRA